MAGRITVINHSLRVKHARALEIADLSESRFPIVQEAIRASRPGQAGPLRLDRHTIWVGGELDFGGPFRVDYDEGRVTPLSSVEELLALPRDQTGYAYMGDKPLTYSVYDNFDYGRIVLDSKIGPVGPGGGEALLALMMPESADLERIKRRIPELWRENSEKVRLLKDLAKEAESGDEAAVRELIETARQLNLR